VIAKGCQVIEELSIVNVLQKEVIIVEVQYNVISDARWKRMDVKGQRAGSLNMSRLFGEYEVGSFCVVNLWFGNVPVPIQYVHHVQWAKLPISQRSKDPQVRSLVSLWPIEIQ
jgi:hypothetical protein